MTLTHEANAVVARTANKCVPLCSGHELLVILQFGALLFDLTKKADFEAALREETGCKPTDTGIGALAKNDVERSCGQQQVVL